LPTIKGPVTRFGGGGGFEKLGEGGKITVHGFLRGEGETKDIGIFWGGGQSRQVRSENSSVTVIKVLLL